MSERRVAFTMAPAMAAEVDRIIAGTDLGSAPEVFRRSLTLLRIHFDADRKGQTIYMVDPDLPDSKYILSLPFEVKT